jgi:hypothetical protein
MVIFHSFLYVYQRVTKSDESTLNPQFHWEILIDPHYIQLWMSVSHPIDGHLDPYLP